MRMTRIRINQILKMCYPPSSASSQDSGDLHSRWITRHLDYGVPLPQFDQLLVLPLQNFLVIVWRITPTASQVEEANLFAGAVEQFSPYCNAPSNSRVFPRP
jgi:hypothetical protein